MAETAGDPKPVYCVYRAGDRPVRCYRAVREKPARVVDFLSFADVANHFTWHEMHRAVGVSAWTDFEKAAALAARKRMVLVELDLGRGDPRIPYAETGSPGHVTIWAPAPILLECVVSYVDSTGGELDASSD